MGVPSKHSHEHVSKALDDYQATLAVHGDRAAFTLLYKRWHPKLLRLARRLTRNADEAQDVMQDVAITIAKNIHKLEDPRRFSAWAYTIVRRRSVDHIQKAVHHREIKDRAGQNPQSTPSTTIEDALTLKQAMAFLSQSDRMILVLFYVDGLTGKEIADALGVPLGTIKSRLFKARAKLKDAYENPQMEIKND